MAVCLSEPFVPTAGDFRIFEFLFFFYLDEITIIITIVVLYVEGANNNNNNDQGSGWIRRLMTSKPFNGTIIHGLKKTNR